MSLNQYQSQNVNVLTPEVVGVIKKRQWRDSSTILLACTICGQKRITGPIVAFYKYRGDLLACYECQALQTPQIKSESVTEAPKPSNWEEKDQGMITDKQSSLLRSLIIEKVLDEGEREQRLNNLNQLTKVEAIAAIGHMLKNQI